MPHPHDPGRPRLRVLVEALSRTGEAPDLDAIARALDRGDVDCLQLSAVCPWVDLTGYATALGLIDARGKQTSRGLDVLRRRRALMGDA